MIFARLRLSNFMKKLLALGYVLVTSSLPSAFAEELHNCNGVLTNRECNSNVVSRPVKASVDAQVRSKKSLLLHDLTMKSLRAKRDFDVGVDISKADEVCTNSSTSVDDCRTAVDVLDDRIEDRLASRALVESAKPPPKQNNPAPPVTTVVEQVPELIIINNERIYPTPRYRNPHHRDHDRDDHHPGHDHDHDSSDSVRPPRPEQLPAVPKPGRMKLPR